MRRKTLGELIAMKKHVLDKMSYREINRSQAAGLLSMHPNAVSRLKKEYLERGEDALIPNLLDRKRDLVFTIKRQAG